MSVRSIKNTIQHQHQQHTPKDKVRPPSWTKEIYTRRHNDKNALPPSLPFHPFPFIPSFPSFIPSPPPNQTSPEEEKTTIINHLYFSSLRIPYIGSGLEQTIPIPGSPDLASALPAPPPSLQSPSHPNHPNPRYFSPLVNADADAMLYV